ncbi:MAG TPA: hypothetical protein VLJ39_09365, partial [Tepidisphaeraceae bacterium]|nr:hypothetical protein [Tepidisphaeraceae bacterium]
HQLAILQQPTMGTAGQALGTLKVEVNDQWGNLMSGDTSNVTLSIGSGAGGTLSGTTTVAASNGIATFNDLTLSAAGTYTLTAADGSLTSVMTAGILVAAVPLPPPPVPLPPPPSPLPPPPAPLPITLNAGVKLQPTALDVSTLAIPDHHKATISIVSAPAGAHTTGTMKMPVSNGQVTVQNLKFTKAGTYTIQVTGGDGSAVQTQDIVVTPSKATRLVFSRQPVNTTAGTPFRVQVEAVDRYGNYVSDDTSVITLKRTWRNDGPTLGGTLSVAMVGGIADFSDLTLNGAAQFELTAMDAAEGLRVDSRVFLVQ